MIFVLLSVNKAVALALDSVAVKSVAFKLAKEFKWLGAYRPAGFAWMTQDLHPGGSLGDATLATAKKGNTSLDHGAKAFVELLREIDRFDLSRGVGRGWHQAWPAAVAGDLRRVGAGEKPGAL